MSLKDKVVLITGASRGIGAAMAGLFAEAGAKVVVNYATSTSNAKRLIETIKDYGGLAEKYQADISKPVEVKKMFDFTIERFGRIDILLNNAGILKVVPLKDASDEDFISQFDINVKGVFNTLREAATRLADNGTIINFSSGVTKMMLSGYGIYSATKSSVEQLSRVFSKEVGRGINVNVLAPGPTKTELFLEGKTQETLDSLAGMNIYNRLATPDEIARIALLLCTEEARWISGQNIFANAGMV